LVKEAGDANASAVGSVQTWASARRRTRGKSYARGKPPIRFARGGLAKRGEINPKNVKKRYKLQSIKKVENDLCTLKTRRKGKSCQRKTRYKSRATKTSKDKKDPFSCYTAGEGGKGEKDIRRGSRGAQTDEEER